MCSSIKNLLFMVIPCTYKMVAAYWNILISTCLNNFASQYSILMIPFTNHNLCHYFFWNRKLFEMAGINISIKPIISKLIAYLLHIIRYKSKSSYYDSYVLIKTNEYQFHKSYIHYVLNQFVHACFILSNGWELYSVTTFYTFLIGREH